MSVAEQRRLIINADDLGLSVAVSRGIEMAHREGMVTSATLMANMPGFEEGVRVARENPALGVGVHLNLIRGCPVAAEGLVRPLLDSGGRFFSDFFTIGRLCSLPEYLQAAEIEYRAQIEKVLAAGVQPDHLDFEKHHGVWRPLYALGARLAAEYGLGIRAYYEPLWFVLRNLPFPGVRRFWRSCHMFFYQFFRVRRAAVFSPDYFFGQSHIGALSREYLRDLIRNLPVGVSELMCHPGMRDEVEENGVATEAGASWITGARVNDLAVVADPEIQLLAQQSGIILGTYAKFAVAGAVGSTGMLGLDVIGSVATGDDAGEKRHG